MKTGLGACLNTMPLFWKLYGLIVLLLIFVIGFVEIIIEPVAEEMLMGISDGFQARHEVALWAVSILLPSLACGYALTRILTNRLGKIAKASKSLARGNLDIRLPVAGNKKDAFDTLSHSFNEMADMIKIQRQSERQLLVNISHELRSPLTRISIATDILDRKHEQGEIAEITRRLEKDVTQMNEMITLLLAQSKERLLAQGENSPVNIGEILRELADDFAFQGEIENKKIQADIAQTLIIYGNAPQLESMFGNILANAMFYSPQDSAIQIVANLRGDSVLVNIQDCGPGVPDEELKEIFRAFYRVDGSRARTSGGLGLGLALAREAAIQHGGNIVALNVNPGLCVTVTLPAYFDEQNSGPPSLL